MQQAVEAWPSSQIEDIEDKLKAFFKARGETTKDKANEVNETKLPKLSAKEVIRMGLPTIPTLWEPIAAVSKLNFKVINFLNQLIFAI